MGGKIKFPWWISSLVLLALAVALKVAQPAFLADLQLRVFDAYQVFSPRAYEPSPVRIVDIDDESLSRNGQWPWPRTQLAELVEKLEAAGAQVIVFDAVFPEVDRTSPSQILPLWNLKNEKLAGLPDHDAQFAKAIAKAPVVGGFALTYTSKEKSPAKAGFSYVGVEPQPYVPAFSGVVTNIPVLEKALTGNGVLNSDPDRDGLLRRIPLVFRVDEQLYPALSVEALRVAQGASSYVVKTVGASDELEGSGRKGITALKVGAVEVPTDANGRFWVYFTKEVPERYVPAWKVLNGTADKELLKEHIILIGTTAAGLKDLRSTPLDPAMAGVEVHAQALEQMISGMYLTRADWIEGAELVLMAVIGLILLLVISHLNALAGAAFMLVSLGAAFTLSWYGFRDMRILVEPVTPAIAIVLLYFSETLRRFIATEQERSRIRHAFGLYMSPALLDQLAAEPEKLRLGGETREISVMFCDIREFSAISENLPPVELTQFINRFLTPMTETVLHSGGTIDKYMGDCIMALWNAPLMQENHAENAVRTALAMRKQLARFNEEVGQDPQYTHVPLPVRMGIGINTGECCIGNIGSSLRFEYSALGNEVDLASRVEALCKIYGVDILIGPGTHAGIPMLPTLEMDLIRVKGKTSAVHVHAVMGDEELKSSPIFTKLAAEHEEMLWAYRGGKWDESFRALKAAREYAFKIDTLRLSMLYRLYEERLIHFRRNPPPPGWDGVFTQSVKA